MAEAISLLEEEDIDENPLLLAFYQENHQFLKRVFLNHVPYELKNEIAVEYTSTSLYSNEWKEFLEALGMTHLDINRLESSKSPNLPLEDALNKSLECSKTFGDIVEVLGQKGKFNILRCIKPFVEGLLRNRDELAETETYSNPAPTAPNYEEIPKGSIYHGATRIYELNLGTSHDCRNDTINNHEIQERKVLEYNPRTIQNPEFHSFFEKPLSKKLLLSTSNIRKANNSLNSEFVSIFIMHAMLDQKYAKRLSSFLKENKFQVITSSDIQHILRGNHTKILKAIHERVDFVIPVVSEFLLKQIQFTGYNTREYKDIESAANCFMYDLLMNEYSSWGCENHRVKPVCVSSESRKLVLNDPILSWSFHLKDEVPKLLQELIKSKKRLEL